MFYTAIWCTGNEASFREAVPLHLLGESLRRYRSPLPLRVAVLEGFERLSPPYVRQLESLGLELIDAEDIFAATVEKYPQIDRCYSRYERNCLLRWPVFSRLLERSGEGGQFWHLDSDIILHVSLDDIARCTAGKTFILQGTPAFVSAADSRWLEIYERELSRLDGDITGYSAAASAVRDQLKEKDLVLCNQTSYRNPIGSDQDLIQYLVGAGILMQDESSSVLGGEYYYVQNSLSLHDWDAFQGSPEQRLFVERGDREIRYGNRRVPFMHYQNSFCSYADVYLKLRNMPRPFLERLLGYRLKDGILALGLPLNLFRKALKHGRLQRSRQELVMRLMDKEGGEMPLIGLLNLLSAVNGGNTRCRNNIPENKASDRQC